jgi:hypothetical protein
MASIRKAALACTTAAMVALSLNAAAQSGPRNQDTYFTFSQPVELPNKTLPAGTYFFQLMDSESNRHIVKVMSQDRKELFATLMAIPFYSNDRPSDEPQVRFMETPATAANSGGTNAVKIWFYPGNSVGHEFIYPRAQALRIAARTGQPVLTTTTESEVTTDAELSRVDRNGVDTEETARASAEVQPAPEPQREQVGAITGGTTQPREPAPAPVTTAHADRNHLPRTAGPLPLLALIGVGSLVSSRLARKAR